LHDTLRVIWWVCVGTRAFLEEHLLVATGLLVRLGGIHWWLLMRGLPASRRDFLCKMLLLCMSQRGHTLVRTLGHHGVGGNWSTNHLLCVVHASRDTCSTTW